jgi:hypothetical protein
VILVLDLAGGALLALFVVALVADVTNWWPCHQCDRHADNPAHFTCSGGRCPPAYHHPYQKAYWPFAVLAALMGLLLVAFVVLQ